MVHIVTIKLDLKWCIHLSRCLFLYTGQQKKGYKVICLLFIKLNDILFLHIVNIMYVVLERICQIWTKFSEATLRHVSLNSFARLARYFSFWVLWKPKSRCSRERMFKSAENHQSLKTNSLQETLALAQKTQNNDKLTSFGKHPYWPWQMTFLSFNVFLASSWIFVQRRKYLRGRDFKIFL